MTCTWHSQTLNSKPNKPGIPQLIAPETSDTEISMSHGSPADSLGSRSLGLTGFTRDGANGHKLCMSGQDVTQGKLSRQGCVCLHACMYGSTNAPALSDPPFLVSGSC